jgi:hypothetical protein
LEDQLPDPAKPDPDLTPRRGRPSDGAAFWRVLRTVGLIASIVAIIALGFVLAKYGYDSLTERDRRSVSLAPNYADVSPAAIQEWLLARADHESIAAAVAACSNIQDLDVQPNSIRAVLRLDTLPNGSRGLSGNPEQKSGGTLTLSNYQRAVIYLSDSIMRSRVEAATNANQNYSSMFWFQLAIVGIGAITTILISIKSIAPTGESPATNNLSLWVGILAIIFSSLGTATSALNSFYGPRESYLKSERSLAGLRQLHSDIAAKVTSTTPLPPEKCPKIDPANKDDPQSKQVQDWTAKLAVIVNAADSGSASSQNAGSSSAAGLPKGTVSAPAQ